MKILAIETSTDIGSVALLDDMTVLAERSMRAPMKLLSWLSPAIAEVLKESGHKLSQVNLIATGIGPGSFTGTRLELATAKTLSQVAKIPLIGVSSLDALAFATLPYRGMILSCIDAKRNELFAGIYASDGSTITQQGDYLCQTKESIVEEASRYKGPWTIVGESNPYESYLLQQLKDATRADESAGIVKASSIGKLAYLRKNSSSGDLYAVEPLYIRASQAELERAKRKA